MSLRPVLVDRVAVARDTGGGDGPAGSRSSGAALGWFGVTAPLLAALAPLLLLGSTPATPQTSSAWPLALALSVVAGLRYAWLVADAERRLFELVFWLFAYVFLGLAALVQLRSGAYPGTTPDLDLTLNDEAMLVVVVGTAAAALGLALGSTAQRAVPRPPGRHLDAARVVAFTVGALVFTGYYVLLVGVPTLLGNRAARASVEADIWTNTTTQAVVKALATLPLVVAFAALVAVRVRNRRAGLPGPTLLPAVVLVTLALVVNPLSSPRYVAGTALLAVLTSLGLVRTRTRYRAFALSLAVGLVFVFPYADIARYGPGEGESKGGPVQALTSPDFDAWAQVNNSLRYVEDEGVTEGRQLLGAVVFFVPRTVWPGKPVDTGILLAEHRGYDVTNLSAPLWAEAYVNGGWLLLVVGMAALGLALRHLDLRARPQLGDEGRPPGVLAGVLPFYAIIVMRGSLLQSMAGLAVLLVSGLAVTAPRRTGRVPA